MSDIQKFLKAIAITNGMYYPGACKWQEFLENGNLMVFTSKMGARNLMLDVNFQTLRQQVFKTMFKNISNYYKFPVNSTTTSNNAVNYLVSNINYYRNKGITYNTYELICNELLGTEFSLDAIEILKNNIERVPGATTISDVNFNMASLFSELLYTQERALEKGVEPSIDELQNRIQELELENAHLKAQLQALNPDDFGSPKV